MLVIDTSVIVAYELEADSNHTRAQKLVSEIVAGKHGRFVITDYIFSEIVTVTALRSKSLEKASVVGDRLKETGEILGVDEAEFNAAWHVFKTQKNTKFSFTDCTTISFMRAHDISKVATFDKDFKNIDWITVVDS